MDGFSVELLRAASHAMGKSVTFEKGTWEDVQSKLCCGEIDGLPLVSRAPKREVKFDVLVPYLTLHGALCT